MLNIFFSKLVSLYKNNAELFKTDFQNTNKIIDTVPLVAIPTTAGSGAESTQFAVMYKENIKFSKVLADSPILVILKHHCT